MNEEIQQIVDRNATLEAENAYLYQTIRDLTAELTVFKASHSKFREDCMKYIQSLTTSSISPSKEMNQKVFKFTREIEILKSQLITSEKKNQSLTTENEKIIQEKEELDKTIQETNNSALQNKQMCNEILHSLLSLENTMKEKEIGTDLSESFQNITNDIDDLTISQQLHLMQSTIESISLNIAQTKEVRVVDKKEFEAKDQTIRDLQTRIEVLQHRADAIDECNANYIKEREDLNNSISTLRQALTVMKQEFVKADKERKELIAANQQLKNAIKEYQQFNQKQEEESSN